MHPMGAGVRVALASDTLLVPARGIALAELDTRPGGPAPDGAVDGPPAQAARVPWVHAEGAQTIRGRIDELATEIVDDVFERRSCDFVTDISGRLPSGLIADLMGSREATESGSTS